MLNGGENLKYQDNHIALVLRKIYDNDQSLRSEIKEFEGKYGIHSKELKEHWVQINKLDSINLYKVKKIVDSHGWLGPKEVSFKGSKALFLVIQHADLKTQLEYLPVLRKAVREGAATGEDLALLEDRVAIDRGNKQMFGSQIHRDADTGQYFLAPLFDPNSVNERRKEIGLGKIEDYSMHWNLNWEAELKRLEQEAKE